MKRLVTASLIALLLIGLLGGGFFYFKKYRTISEKAINAIPADAAFFFDYFADAGNLKKIISSNFIVDSHQEPGWTKLITALGRLDSISTANSSFRELLLNAHLLISAHVTKAADFDFLYLMSLPPGTTESACSDWVKIFAGDPDADIQSRNYDGVTIYELPLLNFSSFTFTVTKGVFAGSFTSFLVEDAIRQQKLKKPFGADKTFLGLYERESVHEEDKIYIKYGNLPKWLSVFADPEKVNPYSLIDNFGGWSVLALQAEKDHISFKGITTPADSNKFISLFSNQQAPEMKLPAILPKKTAAFLYFGASDMKKYLKGFKNYLEKNENGSDKERFLNTLNAAYKTVVRNHFQSWLGNEYALVITEPATTNYDNNLLAVFSAPQPAKALENLRELSTLVSARQSAKISVENYNNHAIGLINLKDVLQALYGDAFKKFTKMFYTSAGNYIIIANQAAALRSFIDDYENSNFLFGSDAENILKKQSNGANFCLFARIPACRYIFQVSGSKQANNFINQYRGLSQWESFSFLIKNTNQGAETYGRVQYAQKPASGVNLVWASELDTAITAGPFFVNLGGDQMGVLVQDAANQVYLIDNAGNIKWKKALQETIYGNAHALDIFRNGQIQLFFSTSGSLYMMDTAGNNMSNFPIRLPAAATNGAAVFDYDENNDYRIYIACMNGRIYGYESAGKPLPGWNFTTATGLIDQPIQHFKRNNQDYLLFGDVQGTVYIVGKFGETLIQVKQPLFRAARCPFYLDEDKEGNYSFVTLDTAGNLSSIMSDGFIRVHPLMEFATGKGFAMTDLNHDGENDFLCYDGKQIFRYSVDSLSLFARIPGDEPLPELILLKSKDGAALIGTWSKSLNKIYLFNTDGSVYKGFPVKGSRRFYMDEINFDGRKNILTASGKEVMLYVLE